ncbi:hypothetical protein C7M84_024934 [Penaeus vannamei]|uniref:Uncharacterized protein n=1 Tax=Penaeus vannamei TaxID=6689 RepID=A0A3R7MGC4_PENVA|nr:hypothetical protein C7M84_024934 [Penaeus vannamei]
MYISATTLEGLKYEVTKPRVTRVGHGGQVGGGEALELEGGTGGGGGFVVARGRGLLDLARRALGLGSVRTRAHRRQHQYARSEVGPAHALTGGDTPGAPRHASPLTRYECFCAAFGRASPGSHTSPPRPRTVTTGEAAPAERSAPSRGGGETPVRTRASEAARLTLRPERTPGALGSRGVTDAAPRLPSPQRERREGKMEESRGREGGKRQCSCTQAVDLSRRLSHDPPEPARPCLTSKSPRAPKAATAARPLPAPPSRYECVSQAWPMWAQVGVNVSPRACLWRPHTSPGGRACAPHLRLGGERQRSGGPRTRGPNCIKGWGGPLPPTPSPFPLPLLSPQAICPCPPPSPSPYRLPFLFGHAPPPSSLHPRQALPFPCHSSLPIPYPCPHLYVLPTLFRPSLPTPPLLPSLTHPFPPPPSLPSPHPVHLNSSHL